jgi:hypothetical protein
VSIKYTNIFQCKTLPNLPKFRFWFENKPSGYPAPDVYLASIGRLGGDEGNELGDALLAALASILRDLALRTDFSCIYLRFIHTYMCTFHTFFICPVDRFFMHLFTFHTYIHFIHLFYCPADRFFVHLFPRKITFHEIFLGFFWKKIFRNFFSAENSNFPRYFWQGKTKYVQAYVMMAAKSLTGYRCGTAALTCSVFFSFGVKGR